MCASTPGFGAESSGLQPFESGGVRNGQTEGRNAEAAARHLLNAQLHNAFYFPDLMRGRVRDENY